MEQLDSQQPPVLPPPLPAAAVSAAAFPSPANSLVLGRSADLPKGIKKPSGYALRSLAVVVAMLVGAVLWLVGAHYVAQWFGISYLSMKPFWALISLLFPALLLLWIGYGIVRSHRSRKLVGDVPKKLDPGSGRLQAVGKTRPLAELVKLGELRDEQFEPIIIFAPRIWPMPKVGTAALVLTTVAVVALIEALRRTTTLPLMQPGWLTVMVGLAVGTGVQMLIWPTYLRITPGRLDVMRFTLGGSRPEVVTVNLRNARVLADFKRSALLVRPEGGAGTMGVGEGSEWVLLNLRGVWRTAETVHAVCRGAVSTAPGAPLPDDRLVG